MTITSAVFKSPTHSWGTAVIDGQSVDFSATPPDDTYHSIVAAGIVIAEYVAPPPNTSVTDLQFRDALATAGYQTQWEAFIAAGAKPLQNWWDRALTISRFDANVLIVGTGIGKSSADLDALFASAATLT